MQTEVMKTRLAVLIASALFAASGLAAKDATPVKDKTSQHIQAKLPSYDKEASEAARKKAEMPQIDDDVVLLPAVTVIQRQEQRMTEQDLYRMGYFDDKLVNQELSGFDRFFLNRYRLPIIGVSQRVRAREKYLERQNSEFRAEVTHIADNVALVDPEGAKALRTALYNMQAH